MVMPERKSIPDTLLVWSALILGGSALAFLTIVGAVNAVVMRKLLNAPMTGTEDLASLAMVILVAVAIPFGGRVGAHIDVEVLEPYFSHRFSRWSSVFLRCLGACLMGLMAWQTAEAGRSAVRFGETTQQLLISYEPFYYLLSACLAIYALILFWDAVQLIRHGKITHIQSGDGL